MSNDRLTAVLHALMPAAMAEAVDAEGNDAAFVAEQITIYLGGDEDDRADMLAFIESGGIAKLESAHEREGGLKPTAEELEGWMGDEPV